MKCPFLVKKIEVFDEEGKKVGEDIEIKDCIKTECMVYDGATNICSLLSSNMKAGVLIDDLNSGFKNIKKEMSERTEVIGTVISNTISAMQEALQERFDIIRKQNEVMVLGFDRLSEVFTNKLGEINERLFDKLADYNENIYPKLDLLNDNLEKLTTTNQTGMETIGREIDKVVNTNQEILKKIDVLDNVMVSINNVTELVKTEIDGMKMEMLNGLNNISTKFDELGKIFSGVISGDFKNEIAQYIDAVKMEINSLKGSQVASFDNIQTTALRFEDLFKASSDNVASMNGMMGDLNKNYLESLGKIAGLAVGMRKGVEKVSDGVQGSVKDLITEMKKEIDLLEKQYRKTFDYVTKLSGKFEEVNNRVREMTKDIQKEFKDSLGRQAELSDYTKVILEDIKGHFEKEDARYKEEQLMLKKKEGIDHFDRATLYYYRGNYELALNEINKALEIEKTVEYLNLKGLLLVELGRFDESQKTYTEALKLEPNLAEIHNNLGLLYLRMKKLDDAVVSFQEAVKKNVNYALAYVNLGKALIDLERFDDAIKAYSRALEIDPSNQDAREAINLYKEGKIGE